MSRGDGSLTHYFFELYFYQRSIFLAIWHTDKLEGDKIKCISFAGTQDESGNRPLTHLDSPSFDRLFWFLLKKKN